MKLILCMILTLSTAATADMYKCMDSERKIAYQDSACENATIGKIKRDTNAGDPAVMATRKAESEKFNERYLERKKFETEMADKKAKEAREERNLRAQEDQARALEDQAVALRAARFNRVWR